MSPGTRFTVEGLAVVAALLTISAGLVRLGNRLAQGGTQ